MKLLSLPRYAPLGASSRLRTFQYLPVLRSAGVEIDVSPLLDDRYVREMYASRIHHARVVASYLRRIRQLVQVRRFDAVWTEKELLPWLPAFIELGILPKNLPLIVDYDDALFHRYDQHASAVVRGVLGSKIDKVMQRADLVLAGNEYLAARARAAGARRVEWLPTVVDMTRYPDVVPAHLPRRGPLVVGWIGSPSTADYLRLVSEPLAVLASRGVIRCVAIGADPLQLRGTPFEAVPWGEQSEVQQLQALDVGIMPLPDAPWERGKCGYKLIQYMACALPVVASAVGVNKDIVEPGVNGYLANDAADWTHALKKLAEDDDLRLRLGRAGRERVEARYSLQVQAPRLQQLLAQTIHGNSR